MKITVTKFADFTSDDIGIVDYNKNNDIHKGYILAYMGDDENNEPQYKVLSHTTLTKKEIEKYTYICEIEIDV